MLGIRTALKPVLECSAAELVYATTLWIPGDFFWYSQISGDLDTSDYVHRLRQVITHLRATPPRPSTNAATFSNDCVICRTPAVLANLRRSRLRGKQRVENLLFRDYAVYGPPTNGTAPLLSADGSTLLTEKAPILQRWTEHFGGVVNRPSAISDATIARLSQFEANVDLDLPPSLQETIRTMQQLSSGKAPGSDAIPAEVYTHGSPQLMDHITVLLQEMWRQG
nr:unnamed protein product [Spirometra erinaceieuropaei]